MPSNDDNDDCKIFLEIMERWLADESFQRYNQTRHWLDYQTFQEANFSNFLAWVLNPREGHGLGDYFIKRLLIAASSCTHAQERMNKWIKEDEWKSLAELETMSLSHSYVAREVSINNKEARIDLILIDPHNELLVLIERKDGSKVSSKQLDKYSKWVSEKYQEYSQLWLVLDSCDKEHEHINDNWIQLNDDWLISAISDVLDRDQLPETINRQLKEFKLVLSGEWQWQEDSYYQGVEDDIRAFTAEHGDDLIRLQELSSITAIDDKEAISNILPSADALALRAIDLAVCNHHALMALLYQNRLGDLERKIKEAYPDKFLTYTSLGKKYHQLNITLKRFHELKDWPLWLHITEYNSEDTAVPKSKYRTILAADTRVDVGKTIPDGIWPKQILILNKYRSRENQQSIRAVSYIDSLDIESIRALLDKLLAIENEIVSAQNRL